VLVDVSSKDVPVVLDIPLVLGKYYQMFSRIFLVPTNMTIEDVTQDATIAVELDACLSPVLAVTSAVRALSPRCLLVGSRRPWFQ
jgi:hypothetical protein